MVSMPKAPDPYATAQAQTGQNFMSSFANSILGNANEITPYGTVTYKAGGYETVTDPSSGKTYQVPRYNRTTKLSPEQQRLLGLQNQTAENLGNLAVQQSANLQGILGTPLNTQGMQDWTALPDWNENDFSRDRGRVEQALMDRWNTINQPQQDKREATLAARGLTPGSQQFGYAADEYGRARNDATSQAILAGGQEQSRLLGERRNVAEFNNALRGQQFGERQTLQAFPVNLITALMSGSQVNVPQAAPYRSTPVQAAPIGEYIYGSNKIASDRAAALNQGLFGLGGAIFGSPLFGGIA
jgi:hypothetical protein